MDVSHISPLLGNERVAALKQVKADGRVFLSIMSAEHGDSAVAVDRREALDTIRGQMAEGKWLRVVMDDGQSDIITSADDRRIADRDSAERLFDSALELALQLSVTGG